MKQWWRTALVTILVVLTGIVAPVSILTVWAFTLVNDTDAFVAAYAPLSDDPAVQETVATKVSDAIEAKLNLAGRTDELIADLTGTNPIAGRLLPSLTGPLNDMVSEFIDKQVNAFVTSDAFSRVWEVALRTTHTQFVALMSGDPASALTVADATLKLQLQPFVEAAQQRLVANGFPLAAQIPEVTTSIDLMQLDPQTVSQARRGYQLLGGLAEWLPWLLLLLPALALLVARDRRRTLIACGAAVTAGIVVAWLAIRAVVERGVDIASANGIPEAATRAITDGSLSPMRGPALAIAALGLIVALLGWLTARRPAGDVTGET